MVLDTKSRDGGNGSRREKARLEKALVRLVNARTDGDLEAARRAFPDLLSASMERIKEARFALLKAWGLRESQWQRMILIDEIGRTVSEGGKGRIGLATLLDKSSPIMRRRIVLSRTALFQLLLQAYESRNKMRVCQNRDCPHPFYLRSEGGKQFCSKVCAAPSQRAAKLKWWNQHKRELLARRRGEYRKRKKRAGGRNKSRRREKRQ